MKRRAIALAAALLAAVFAPRHALAQPAVIYELGGKADRSFNQAAWQGAEAWRQRSGKPYLEFEIAQAVQREQAARRFAQRGADPIVAIGFPQASSIAAVAREYPERRFAIIDAVVDLPNVQSVVFREHEGAYLAGMAAALASRSHVIGFVGGMDVPLVRRFLCGYEQGARRVDPRVEVLSAMAGATPAAWTDPARGAELARAQLARGADVVFAAAGTTGLGVMQAVRDAGRLSIGVDSNQNHLHPGHVLTSMVKRVDLAVQQAFDGVQPGVRSLGLKEGALDLAMDAHNERLVTPAMRAQLAAAREQIVSGALTVVDYVAAQRCA